MANRAPIKVDVVQDTADLNVRLRESVNGILAHELAVGDVAYIKNESKMFIPFDADNQYMYSVAMGMKPDLARCLTVARMGLMEYWGAILTGVDQDEAVAGGADGMGTFYNVVSQNGQSTFTPKNGGRINNVQIVPDKPFAMPEAETEQDWEAMMKREYAAGVKFEQIYLHMKDVGMLVSANLVKTGHHYQDTTNGAFRAVERKRFGKEVFDGDTRGIIYHEAMHPYVQLVKLTIYSNYMAGLKANNLAGTYMVLDQTVTKRLPVVPAGAAWLSAGLTIMYELMAIPIINSKIPKDYNALIKSAEAALAKVKDTGRSSTEDLTPYGPFAAFAWGILHEVAPNHSAAKAPSLIKIADQHLGARTAGEDLGRKYLRGDLDKEKAAAEGKQ